MTSPLQQQLEKLATEALAAHGLVLVQVRLSGGGSRGRTTLQILTENPDGSSPAIETCARASRTLGAQLDVADTIAGRYVLEVSSPGLERPLMTPADYTRFLHRHARLAFLSQQPIGDQQLGAAAGLLLEADATHVTLKPDAAPAAALRVAYSAIKQANLDPSAEEIALFMKRQALPGEVFSSQEEQPELNS